MPGKSNKQRKSHKFLRLCKIITDNIALPLYLAPFPFYLNMLILEIVNHYGRRLS